MLRFNREISGVDISLFAEGQLESPLIMSVKFPKVKQFFKNNFQKKPKKQKAAEIRHFFYKVSLVYLTKFYKKSVLLSAKNDSVLRFLADSLPDSNFTNRKNRPRKGRFNIKTDT